MKEKRHKNILIIENSVAVTGAFNDIFDLTSTFSEDYRFIFALPTGSLCTIKVKEQGFKAYEFRYAIMSKRIVDLLLFLSRAFLFFIKLNKIIFL